MTFGLLRRLNAGWSDDDFIDVFTLASFLSDGDLEPQRLKVRFALVLYGDSEVRRFVGNTVWIV